MNIVHDTVANMHGEQLTLRFVENPAKQLEGVPDGLTIQRYNFRSPHDPVIIYEPRNRILYSGPAGPGRTNLTFRVSADEGQSWKVSHLLSEGPSGYSDLAVLDDGRVGCLFEAGFQDYRETIRFGRFELAD